MTRTRNYAAALLTVGGFFIATEAHADWQNNAPFGTTMKGDLFTPSKPASPPAILVAIHMCGGTSSVVQHWFDAAAEKSGFYIIAPQAPGNCFDASASRDGDKASIVAMVNYVLTNKKADKSRVFAAGMSSGGCMTNTLLAVYPDVFVGGSAMPGFPAGGWPAGDTTCTQCSKEPPSVDGKYWGDKARAAFSWTGDRPCSQQWVGNMDEYKFNDWLPAVAAQFQNLGNLGASLGAGASATSGISGWTRTVYKDTAGNIRLETNLGPNNQKHDLEPVGAPLYADVIRFLGLDKPSGSCGLTSTTVGGGSGGASSGGAPGSAGAPSTGSAGSAGTGPVAGGAGTPGTGSGGTGAVSGGAGAPSNGAAGAPITSSGGSSNTSAGSPAVAGSTATSHAGATGTGTGTGTAGATGGGGETPPGDSGCGCRVGALGHSVPTPLVGLLAVGIGAFFARRRRAQG